MVRFTLTDVQKLLVENTQHHLKGLDVNLASTVKNIIDNMYCESVDNSTLQYYIAEDCSRYAEPNRQVTTTYQFEDGREFMVHLDGNLLPGISIHRQVSITVK